MAALPTTSDETSVLTSSFAGGHVALYGATPTESVAGRRTNPDIFSACDRTGTCVVAAAAVHPAPGTGQRGIVVVHGPPESVMASNDIFLQEQMKSAEQSSSKSSLTALPSGRTLFGVWDGVFTSCIINMFGVVVFIRTGWMVGHAGIGESILIVLLTVSVSLVAVLSAIGIHERSNIERIDGGIYSLLRHVLGARVGASVGLVYCFGQSVACSLCVVGFGESIVDLLAVGDVMLTRLIAVVVLILIVVINMADVRWVVGLQVILIFLLFVAVLDFLVGSFIRISPEDGVIGYSLELILNNTDAQYESSESFFDVLGVFFPSSTGALAGVNMGGDLRDPTSSIPLGTLAAIAVCASIDLLFVFVLGATCRRSALRSNFMIAEKLSATRIMWLVGLYELTLSSAIGNISGSPSVLQGIASDNVIPLLAPLAKGYGANRIPVRSIAVMSAISLLFIFIGPLNTLGTILTIPFMFTYAAVDFAYFSLVMSDDDDDRMRRYQSTSAGRSVNGDVVERDFITSGVSDYDVNDEDDGDLDRLFPNERKRRSLVVPGTGTGCTRSEMDTSRSNGGHPGMPSDDNDHVTRDQMSFSDPPLVCPQRKYSRLCNKWISLIGAIVSTTAMFAIQWIYAVAVVVVAMVMWFLIGRFNSDLFPGVAELHPWSSACAALRRMRRKIDNRVLPDVVSPSSSPTAAVFDVTTAQLNDDNNDFPTRQRYHQTTEQNNQ